MAGSVAEQRPLSLVREAMELLAEYQRAGDVPLLTAAVSGFRAALAAALSAGLPDVAAYHNNLGYALHELAEATDDPAAAAEAVRCHRAALAATETGDPDRVGYLCTLSSGLRAQYKRAQYKSAGNPELLVEAVAAAREAIDSPSDDEQPGPVTVFAVLAGALEDWYEYQADEAVLNDLIEAHRSLVRFAEFLDEPGLPAHWDSLGRWLRERFERSGDTGALAESIEFSRKAVAAAVDDQRLGYLSNLGDALRLRFERTGDLKAITEAVTVHRLAVAGTWPGNPDLPRRANNLAGALSTRYERTADAATLAEAIRVARQAVAAAPPGAPELGGYLNNLQVALELEFERTGSLETLSESVRVAREAVAAAPPGHRKRALCLGALARALGQLYDQTGDDELLAEHVEASRDVLAVIAIGHPGRATALQNLGQALDTLFGRTGDLATLDEAVRVTRESIAATSADEPVLAGRLAALSSLLDTVIVETGNGELLGEAVAAARAAVGAVPADHPSRAMLLDQLGAALTREFVLTRNSAVLIEAVRVRRQALAAIPDGHTSRVTALINLATSVNALARRKDEGWTVVEAAQLTAEAVDTLPEDHPARALCLHNLARIYSILSRRLGDPDFLDRAIRCARQSLVATPADHADIATRLATLSRLLLRQSADAGDDELLAEGLRVAREALAVTRADGPDYGDQLDLLAWALYLRYQVTGDTAAATEAWQCMDGAARHPLASVILRIGSYRRMAEFAPLVGRSPQEALARIEAAVDLLPAVLPGQLERTDQEYEIGRVTDLAVGAAETAISAGRPDRAIELLERTRGVLVAGELDRRAGHDHHAPLNIAELGDIARDGPVVYLNAGPLRCDAFALVAGANPADPPDVRHIPLAVSPSDVDVKTGRLLTLVGLEPADEEMVLGDPLVQQEMLAILGWIREHVTGPVLAAFGYDRVPADTRKLPRIWWCPVGNFACLPLHASCLDEVVSSYAFTARGLRQARTQPPPDAASGPLVITVSDAPGTTPLPGADLEAEVIAGIFPAALRLAQPTKKAVLDALPRHPVVHFACHGAVDLDDPGHSQLFLSDHLEAPLTVADIVALRLPGGLAFLSACETAVTSSRLSNEAVHLTGAFQLAGYRDVVGTLWQVSDYASAKLVGDFYRTLTAPSRHRVSGQSQAAIALNQATRRLRDSYPDWPAFWTAHIHVGP